MVLKPLVGESLIVPLLSPPLPGGRGGRGGAESCHGVAGKSCLPQMCSYFHVYQCSGTGSAWRISGACHVCPQSIPAVESLSAEQLSALAEGRLLFILPQPVDLQLNKKVVPGAMNTNSGRLGWVIFRRMGCWPRWLTASSRKPGDETRASVICIARF